MSTLKNLLLSFVLSFLFFRIKHGRRFFEKRKIIDVYISWSYVI